MNSLYEMLSGIPRAFNYITGGSSSEGTGSDATMDEMQKLYDWQVQTGQMTPETRDTMLSNRQQELYEAAIRDSMNPADRAAAFALNGIYNVGNVVPYAMATGADALGYALGDTEVGRALGITNDHRYRDDFPFAEMSTTRAPWQQEGIEPIDVILNAAGGMSLAKAPIKAGIKELERIAGRTALAEEGKQAANTLAKGRAAYNTINKELADLNQAATLRDLGLLPSATRKGASEARQLLREGRQNVLDLNAANRETLATLPYEEAFINGYMPNVGRLLREIPESNMWNNWIRTTGNAVNSPVGIGMSNFLSKELSDGSNATDKDMEVLAQRAQAALQNQGAGSAQNGSTLPQEAAQNASQISGKGAGEKAPQAAIPTLDEAVNNYTTKINELINAARDLPTEEVVDAELSQYMSPELVEAALQEYRARNDALTSMMAQQRIRDEERQNLRARLAAIRERRGREYDDNILNTVFRIFLGPVQALKFGKDPFQADNEAREYYITQDPEYQELIGLISDTQDLPSRKENMEALLGASRQKLGDILNVRGVQSDIAQAENKRRNRNVISVADQLKFVADLEAAGVNARTKAENAKLNKLATQSMLELRGAQLEQKRKEQLNEQFVNMVASFGEQEAIRRMIEIYGRDVLSYLVTSGEPTSGTSKYGKAMKEADRRQ